MASKESAMAALLYLLYNCPHCLTRGSQPITLGWKDVFKVRASHLRVALRYPAALHHLRAVSLSACLPAVSLTVSPFLRPRHPVRRQALRAVKCRYPDGSSRVGVWDAIELAREPSEASTASGSSRSSSPSPSQTSVDRRRRDSNSGRSRHHDDSSRSRRHSRSRDGHRSYPRQPYDTRGPYRDARMAHPHPDAPAVYDPEIYGPGYNPAVNGRRVAPYDVQPEVVATQVALGLDPATAAELRRLAGGSKSYNYMSSMLAPPPMVIDDGGSTAAAVRQRIATDLRMSRVRPARQLNVAELARRKVHPGRRTVVLELYGGSPDGTKLCLDSATGERVRPTSRGATRDVVTTTPSPLQSPPNFVPPRVASFQLRVLLKAPLSPVLRRSLAPLLPAPMHSPAFPFATPRLRLLVSLYRWIHAVPPRRRAPCQASCISPPRRRTTRSWRASCAPRASSSRGEDPPRPCR
jgi:hypothetical protein